MKLNHLIGANLFALLLTACSAPGDNEAPEATMPETPMLSVDTGMSKTSDETPAMDDPGHVMSMMEDGEGYATGTVRSLGPEGDFLTIQHGPFEGGIQMSAMTMGFDIMTSVDVSAVAEGDEIAFLVKKGRDGTYRITALCQTAVGGPNCLNDIMEQKTE